MENLLEIVLQISLSTAAVIGVLLLLVPLWQKRYSARWRKVIWLLLAIRLLIPFSPELSVTPVQMDMNWQAVPAWQSAAMDNAIPDAADVAVTGDAVQTVSNAAQSNMAVVTDTAEATGIQVSRGEVWALIWLIGISLFLLIHGIQYVIFHRKVLKNALSLPEQDNLLRQAGEGLKLHSYPDVMVSSEAQGPMLIGFMKPMIILPERSYSQQELLLILRHELVHHQQHDLWYKLVLLVANAVHWFNPLVYLLIGQANRDVEQVCDEKVVANQDMAYRKAYSMTILQAMSNSRGIALSTYLSKEAQNGKKRFTAILYPQQYKKGLLLLCVVIAAAVGISGCLQVGEKDEGLVLYEQVAPWLPEHAIHNPKKYDMSFTTDGSEIWYTWQEGKFKKKPEELHFEGEEPWGFKRVLIIQASIDTGQVLHYIYWNDVPGQVTSVYGKAAEEEEATMRACAEKFAHEFIPGGEILELEGGHEVYLGNGNARSRSYKTTNTVNNYQFRFSVDCETLSITSFGSYYYSKEQGEQALAWLNDKYMQNMGNDYQFTIKTTERLGAGSQSVGTSQYTNLDKRFQLYTEYMIMWQPKLTEKQQQRLTDLKVKNEESYQTIADFAKLSYADSNFMTIEAGVNEDDTLDFTDAKIYVRAAKDNTTRGLDFDMERERWQMVWTAAGYANSYVEKQKDAMAFFGTTENMSFPEYEYYATPAYLLKNCDECSERWGGKAPFELQIALPLKDDSVDYLTMQLEKVNDEWQVTDAQLEK